jgi:hypothetical protein
MMILTVLLLISGFILDMRSKSTKGGKNGLSAGYFELLGIPS